MNKQALLEKLKQQDIPEEIINAFEKVKREAFIPDHLVSYSYEDMPMPLADGSTVSQPSTIAFMLKLLDLKQNQKVLFQEVDLIAFLLP
jgi:protein-L-isoaspartate(D-aspartate) O-methyltransferase